MIGFEGNGKRCEDVDECAEGTHVCSDDAVCENLLGSFSCTCNDGFIGDGQTCRDVDECDLGKPFLSFGKSIERF